MNFGTFSFKRGNSSFRRDCEGDQQRGSKLRLVVERTCCQAMVKRTYLCEHNVDHLDEARDKKGVVEIAALPEVHLWRGVTAGTTAADGGGHVVATVKRVLTSQLWSPNEGAAESFAWESLLAFAAALTARSLHVGGCVRRMTWLWNLREKLLVWNNCGSQATWFNLVSNSRRWKTLLNLIEKKFVQRMIF